ncbi:MAG: hypothetical protein M3Q27_12835 [Actinomycetota bacterium]|nr:hypothetical protein [Actinomycetota bacterium]
MGRDEDFTEYVAARWARLVRAAVLLGCSPAEAEDAVQTALTRSRSAGPGFNGPTTGMSTCTAS